MLPKDERKLLALYFRKIGKADEQETFKDFDDMKALGWKQDKADGGAYDEQYIDRVCNADDMLKKRGFIGVLNRDLMERAISLTIEGYDLGRKYNKLLIKSGLWFEEYKNHWIWLIVAFLGGITGTLLVNWLSR